MLVGCQKAFFSAKARRIQKSKTGTNGIQFKSMYLIPDFKALNLVE